jgi:hypothetical protein
LTFSPTSLTRGKSQTRETLSISSSWASMPLLGPLPRVDHPPVVHLPMSRLPPLLDHQLPEALLPRARRRASSTSYLRAFSLASMWGSRMHKRFVPIGSTLMKSSLSWRLVRRPCSLSTTSSNLPSASLWTPPPPVFYNSWEIYDDTSMIYGAPPADIDDEDFGGGETEEDDSPPAAHSPHNDDDCRASSFWRLMPKGECAHNLSMWGWCVSPCLSLYLS